MMPGLVSRRTKWIAAVLGLIVLAVVLPPFLNVNRYRNQAAASIGRALGREVTVSNIELKMMPRPGLVLSGFVVADAPSYGAEPMLRADTVTAALRLTSLWRGRLEIGTLSLENPSLNLVRRDDGRWNVEDLLERTSQAQSAPTALPNPAARTRFPYVEATGGRINFKLANVKKAFAFSEADFALWLETDDKWGVRLEARPTRSDVPLAETGLLRVEGDFQRASRLDETPVRLKINYSKGQLGQVTTLIYGRDRGWRGAVAATAALAGSPTALAVTTDLWVEDFRRYDIALGEALRLSAHCTGTYSSRDDSLRGIQCEAPVKPGTLTVRGDVTGWKFEAFNLGVNAEQIPIERLVALARHTKKDLPDDLTANGSADAQFMVRREAGATPVWSGGGRTTHFAVQSKVLKQDLELGPLEFAIADTSDKHGPKRSKATVSQPQQPPLRVAVKPFAMPLGAASPATAEGYFDLAEYKLSLRGDAELSRLMAVARATGIAAPSVGLAGVAQLDFTIAGGWTGFAPPTPSGKLQIRDATAEFQGVQQPLQVAAATVTLAEQSVSVGPFTAGFKDGPTLSGSATIPVGCAAGSTCSLHFDLRAPEMSLTDLNRLFNPTVQSRPWYHLLALGQRDDNALAKLYGSGRVSVGKLALGNAVATNVTATLDIHSGVVNAREVKADVLGGKHTGNWDADFTVSPPKFYGSGSVSKMVMAQVASLMHDPWATGMLSAQYTLGLTGLDARQMSNSVTGSATFDWTSGTLRHISLDGKVAPLAFSSLNGSVAIGNQSLTCQQCILKSASGAYAVSGTVDFAHQLKLALEQPGGQAFTITGTLEKPVVEAAAAPPAKEHKP